MHFVDGKFKSRVKELDFKELDFKELDFKELDFKELASKELGVLGYSDLLGMQWRSMLFRSIGIGRSQLFRSIGIGRSRLFRSTVQALTKDKILTCQDWHLRFSDVRYSIFSFCEIISKIMLVRYRGINDKGVLERPLTIWTVLDAISSTLKFQFAVKCWSVDFLIPCKTKSCQSSTECLRMVSALPPDTPRPPQIPTWIMKKPVYVKNSIFQFFSRFIFCQRRDSIGIGRSQWDYSMRLFEGDYSKELRTRCFCSGAHDVFGEWRTRCFWEWRTRYFLEWYLNLVPELGSPPPPQPTTYFKRGHVA